MIKPLYFIVLSTTATTYRPVPVSDEEQYVDPVDSISIKERNMVSHHSAVSVDYYNCQQENG